MSNSGDVSAEDSFGGIDQPQGEDANGEAANGEGEGGQDWTEEEWDDWYRWYDDNPNHTEGSNRGHWVFNAQGGRADDSERGSQYSGSLRFRPGPRPRT